MSNIFGLGDFALASGETLSDAKLSYVTFGQLNAARDNCVLLPTYYGGTQRSYDPLIGLDRALDPSRWFIVVADMFGNGLSSSPSNWSGKDSFPNIAIGDNIVAQQRLLFDHLGVASLALVAGWSMGGMQALHWGFSYPDLVKRIACWCGTARCWPLNQMFLEGIRAALLADSSLLKHAGRRAFGRTYAGWAYSAQFYRDELWRGIGFEEVEDFLQYWEEDHLGWDYRDLLCMLSTWRTCDPAAFQPPNRLKDLLGRIRARTLIISCDQDMYFTTVESALEADMIPNSEMVVLQSPYGHCAGAPGRFPRETSFIDNSLREFLKK